MLEKMLKRANIIKSLTKPVSASSLGLFRIFVGLMMLWQLARIEPYIVNELTKSKFFLTYDFFHWIKVMPRETMSHLFFFLKLISLMVCLGVFYRLAITLLFLGWSYIFLLDAGHYNNHYYLYCILLFLMIFLDADRWMSIRKVWNKQLLGIIPFWQIFIIRFQLFIVYFYGGLAKLEHDWLHAYPMRIWMYINQENPGKESFLNNDFTLYFLSWTGLVFDLSIGFLLLFRKTRYWALIPLSLFHISNHFLWNIGTFPWFMLGATFIFFEPDLPKNLIGKLFKKRISNKKQQKPTSKSLGKTPNWLAAVLIVYFCLQLLLPFRQFFFKGNTSWHGQGQYFAWRMMLADRADAIKVKLGIPGKGIVGQVQLQEYININQFLRMPRQPKSFNRLAQFVKAEVEKNSGIDNAEVYVVLWRQLNGRPYQLLIDSTVNLADYPYSFYKPAKYLLPFKNTAQKLDINTLDEYERNIMKLKY